MLKKVLWGVRDITLFHVTNTEKKDNHQHIAWLFFGTSNILLSFRTEKRLKSKRERESLRSESPHLVKGIKRIISQNDLLRVIKILGASRLYCGKLRGESASVSEHGNNLFTILQLFFLDGEFLGWKDENFDLRKCCTFRFSVEFTFFS